MKPEERIAAIAERFRSASFPDKVVAAIQDYLSGRGTLEWWLTGMRVTNERYFLPADALVGLLGSDDTSLDEIDRRLLEVCYATGSERAFIMSVAADGPVEAVRDYLMERGEDEQAVLQRFLDVRLIVVGYGRQPAALDRLLLSYIPDRFDELAPLWESHPAHAATVMRLLLAVRPPYLELAWRVAEDMIAIGWGMPAVAPVLLAADRSVFFERLRPELQRYVAATSYNWQTMLDLLLAEDWDGRLAYAASLLTHRSRAVRAATGDWLVQQGQAVIDSVSPYLTATSPDARAASVRVLGRIGGERARTLLVERRAVEQTWLVKQALFETVGFPWATPDNQSNLQSFIEAITTEVARVMPTPTGPVLAWLDPQTVARLRWATGEPVPTAVVDYLMSLQSLSSEAGAGEHLYQFAAALQSEAAAAWAGALLAGWVAQGAPVQETWLLPLVGVLGDDRLILTLRSHIEEWSKGGRGAIAARATHALALIDSEMALATVEELGERVKHKQVQDAAQQALVETARRRDLTPEELADQMTPRLGFDAHGRWVFDYGPRRFTARLGLDLAPRVYDEAGKNLTGLPRPLKSDDGAKAAAAQAEWKRLKVPIKQAGKQQTLRLERALVSQRTWDLVRWRELFLQHPLLRPMAVALLWGLLDEAGTGYTLLFRPLEDGSLTGADDEPVELPAEGRTRLVHPVELDEATRAAWLAHLADYEVSPPFPQLSRPVVRVMPEERDQQWWTPYLGYVMNGAALKGRYQKAAWRRGSLGGGGAYFTIWKRFPAAGIEAVLETAGLLVGKEQQFNTALKRLAFVRAETDGRNSDVYDDLTVKDEHALTLGEVPPVVFSEAAGDVATFAAAGQYDPDWERKVW